MPKTKDGIIKLSRSIIKVIKMIQRMAVFLFHLLSNLRYISNVNGKNEKAIK